MTRAIRRTLTTLAVLLIAATPNTPAHAAPTPATPAQLTSDTTTITLHVIRGLHRRTGTPDQTTRNDFADFTDSLNTYLAAAGAPQRIILGDVTPWSRIPRRDACSLSAGHTIAARNGWATDPSVKVLTYQPGCGKTVAGGQAEIGGTYLTVDGGTTHDVLAHELLHTLGLGHSTTSSCIVNFTTRNRVCPYRSTNVLTFQGIYGDTSDLAGGYNRGSVGAPDRLQPSDLTGLLNRTHLNTLGISDTDADTDLDLTALTTPTDIVLPTRDTNEPGRYLHLTDGTQRLITLSLSSGDGLDRPYQVRPDPTSPAPTPEPAAPQLLAHTSRTVGPLGDTTLLNAIPGSRLTLAGPGRFGSGLLPGLTYPLVLDAATPPHTLTVIAVDATEALLRIRPRHPTTPDRLQTRVTKDGPTAATTLTWRHRGTRVLGVTVIWRDDNQHVQTRYLDVTPGDTTLEIRDLPLLSGKGGWRFHLHTSETDGGALTAPTYLPATR